MSLTKEKLLQDPKTKQDRSKLYPKEYNQTISQNLDRLLEVMLRVESLCGKSFVVASGWRPPTVNESTANAAGKSRHLIGLACDIEDLDGSLMKWVIANLDLLADLGLYFENFDWTPTWVHFQLLPPGSKRRIYVPSTAPAIKPGRWDGKYDHKFDY